MFNVGARRFFCFAVVVIVGSGLAPRAEATFHLWDFKELFSNADGTVQFIELFTAFSSQQFAMGEQFRSSQGASTQLYTFPSNTAAPTTNHHLLIATAGFAALPGAPAPDFIMPDGFLFTPNGTLQNLSLGGPTMSYANLPTDGVTSLAGDGVTTGLNSPTNFAGDTGTIDVSQPEVPAVSEWGVVLLAVGLAISGELVLRGRSGRRVPVVRRFA